MNARIRTLKLFLEIAAAHARSRAPQFTREDFRMYLVKGGIDIGIESVEDILTTLICAKALVTETADVRYRITEWGTELLNVMQLCVLNEAS